MMELISTTSFSPTTLFTVFAILISLFFCIFSSLIKSRRSSSHSGHDKVRTVPEPSGSWPLLGHLPLLGGSKPLHRVLADLADRWGPIFTVRLGVNPTIIVSTWEIAKECLTTHDRTFATRPKSVSWEVLGFNYALFSLSPYGPYWRQVRKISTVQLLSSHRLELLKHVRESEVQTSINDAYESWRNRIDPATEVLMDMNKWFGDITLNVILRMIIGKRFCDGEVDEKERKALHDYTEVFKEFAVSDALPFLRWLDIGGHERATRRAVKEFDGVLQRWLDEHKAAMRSKQYCCGDDEEDFMDVMLSALEDSEEFHTYDVDTVIKATCVSLMLGATDTTTLTLIWTLSLLLNHTESLNKVQQELDAIVGRDKQVNESDFKNLSYLQAVIKETLRLYPAGSIGLPHEATEDCTLQGYFVPKGTHLLLNLHKIQRDSQVWPDPNEFKPERFLTTHKDFDVRGQNFGFIPFGSGRRMCPGISMALLLLGLSLASFLQAFEVKRPKDEPVDMSEAVGMSNVKATPLEVLIKPRLPLDQYSKSLM